MSYHIYPLTNGQYAIWTWHYDLPCVFTEAGWDADCNKYQTFDSEKDAVITLFRFMGNKYFSNAKCEENYTLASFTMNGTDYSNAYMHRERLNNNVVRFEGFSA